jgi:hypothetical protein
LDIGHSFFGAVISEQAVSTTEATIAVAMRRRRRIMGVSPDWGEGHCGSEVRSNVPASANPEMAFSYQKMPVSYQKQHFFYHFPLAPLRIIPQFPDTMSVTAF